MHDGNSSHDAGQSSPPHKPRASWYAQGLSDGLGDRLLMFDNSDSPSLELLRFSPELAQAPGFETALRERVHRLRQFRHAAFAQVRSVQRLEPENDLALISNWTPGKRLSEVIHEARGPAFAGALIRQLAPALVLLQQHDAGLSHGVLSPDRIVVSPEGRLTIVEHVIGPAINRLDLGPKKLRSLGVPLPPATAGAAPRLDVATDWYQLGLVALSVLIGRPVTTSELPQLEAMLNRLDHPSLTDGASVSPVMRQWLDRALQISGSRIESGADGRAALEEFLHKDRSRDSRRVESPRREQAPPIAVATAQTDRVAAIEEPRRSPGVAAPPARPAAAVVEARARPITPSPVRPSPARPEAKKQWTLKVRVPGDPRGRTPQRRAPLDQPAAARSRNGPGARREPDVDHPHPAAGPGPQIARPKIFSSVVAILGIVAAVEAGIIVGLARPVFAPRAELAVETGASGENMLVSGGAATSAPLRVTVAPDLRWVRVTTASPARATGRPTGGMTAGIIQISSPIQLEVFEQSRRLGSAPGAGLELAPGRHEIELVNAALGYRLRQAIQVEAGQTVALHVAPADGWVTIDAAPWAEVSVDGQAVGRTPLVTLPIAVGEHEVAFRHPGLGSDSQRVTVRSDAISRVTGNLRQ